MKQAIDWGRAIMVLNPQATQIQIGRRYGISQSSISYIINGNMFPTFPQQQRIAKEQGWRLSQLLQWMEDGCHEPDKQAA